MHVRVHRFGVGAGVGLVVGDVVGLAVGRGVGREPPSTSISCDQPGASYPRAAAALNTQSSGSEQPPLRMQSTFA